MLDDTDTSELLLSVCDSLSQARVSSEIAEALMEARITALTKPDGGVRGIATGFSEASGGKNTREAVQQSVRDRVCAFPVRLVHRGGDRLRRANVARSNGRETIRALLPFVTSQRSWCDEEGERRTVTQAEGGERGDPLVPLLFAIGIQGVLEEVATIGGRRATVRVLGRGVFAVRTASRGSYDEDSGRTVAPRQNSSVEQAVRGAA